MNELILLKYYILDKDIYNQYYKYLNTDYYKNSYNELYKILLVIQYIHNTSITITSINEFKAYFFNQYPSLKKAEKDVYESIFLKLDTIDLSQETIHAVLEGHRSRCIASKVAQTAWDASNGQKSILDLSAALQTALTELGETIIQEEPPEFVTDDIDSLLDKTYSAAGLVWRLKTLQKMMGSLRHGTFGFVTARPEVGKTTFLADMGSFFASQLDKPYIHFNNEELGDSVKLRYIQATLGQTIAEINQNRANSIQEFLRITKGNIKIRDSASISKIEVEKICAQMNPGMIVFDSIDKIKGFEGDRDDLVYKQIYAWARELSKVYGPVIGACHASAGAEGKEWLEMDDVAYAKTAKQGEADWILGIGRSFDTGKEYVRSFHLSKNKLMGDVGSIEEYRHGKVRVLIHPEIAQYDDIQFKE